MAVRRHKMNSMVWSWMVEWRKIDRRWIISNKELNLIITIVMTIFQGRLTLECSKGKNQGQRKGRVKGSNTLVYKLYLVRNDIPNPKSSKPLSLLYLCLSLMQKNIICGQLLLQMRIVVQLVQSYLKQQIPTILITTDTNKYLFNIPSSFQRFTRENKIKLPTMSHYFFTKSHTNTITGLTGLLLTMYERGDSCNTRLYLDDKLYQYMEELRYKMGFKVAPISYCSWEGKLRKGINNFQKIIEMSQREDFSTVFSNLSEFIDQEIPEAQQNNAKKFLNVEQKFFQNEEIKIIPFQIESKGEKLTNFIVVPNELPGKMLNDRLKAFGIKGAAISQLVKNGKITVNGREILLEQVKQPDSPSPNIIILHYNSISSIEAIINNEVFKTYLQNPKNFTYCVIHIVEQAAIITSPQFKFILSLFNDQVEHLVYNRQYRNSTDELESLVNLSAQVQLVSGLNKFFPLCMPNLEEIHVDYVKQFIGATQAIDLLFPQKKVKAYKKCHQLVVSPKKSWGYKLVYDIKKEKKPELIQLQAIVPQDTELDFDIQEKVKIVDPKVVFLGTGSMKPSKYRNVSSILVEFGASKMLLDCGEGSHIQIAEHYGYQKYEEVLLDIRTIFITHIHSDHNLGILDLISERNAIIARRGLNKTEHTLFLVLPANVVPWFESFCQNIENLKEGCEVIFIQSLRGQSFSFQGTMSKEDQFNRKCSARSDMVDESEESEEQDEEQLNFIKPEWEDVLKQYALTQLQSLQNFKTYLNSAGIVQFLPSPVIHCPQSYGVIIKHISDIKISYSGDTRPCSSFAEDAINSTIMIHQATFGDDLQGNAESHFHSTVGEAIDIGMRSKSWKTALTHFSQRYKSACEIVQPKMYKINKEKQNYAQKHTIVCFDHFQMNVSKAHLMPYYSRGVANAIPKDNKE